MTEDRLEEITRALSNSPLRWAMRWCEAEFCSCIGCASTAIRVNPCRPSIHPELQPLTISKITKEEWQEWWTIQGQRLGGR